MKTKTSFLHHVSLLLLFMDTVFTDILNNIAGDDEFDECSFQKKYIGEEA